MSRARELTAGFRDGALTCPSVGMFEPTLVPGIRVRAGDPIGWLDVLGVRHRVVAPAHTRGVVRASHADATGLVVAQHDTPLYALDDRAADDAADPSAATAGSGASASAVAAGELVFRAPTSGRYYGRPSPDKPAFVELGGELSTGATICLLEVMKTFNRVTYGGAGLPARAKVRSLLVADGADVNAGDPLIALEPAS